ncbi:MAG: manganese ABC transporter ATP-binding protein [Patescibacteria group bacterium]
MKAIEVKNLNVKFGNLKVLDNLNFDIEEGLVTAIIGPNGSGKSTLLKAIMGIIPYEGEIKIFGEDHKKNLHLLGYVPQSYEIDKFLPMTVKEFLFYSSLNQKENYEQKILKVLNDLDIIHYENRKLKDLSGGQVQRVLFARSLINDPKILLLDEPISEIDIVGQKEFYNIIHHLNKDHKLTILIVTHEVTIVHHFAHHVLCLNKKLVCNGPISLLFNEKILKELYGREIFIYPFNKPINFEENA